MTNADRAPPDETLVLQARGGAPQALAELLQRHEPALRRSLARLLRNAHDLDDCLQETWMRIAAAMPRFREGSPFAPWAHTIATHVAISLLRRRRVHTGLESAHERSLGSDDVDPGDALVREEQAEDVRRAIRALPARFRRVVELRLVRELDHQEIARILRLSHGAVRVLFCRGIRHLRRALKGNDASSS